MRLVEVAIGTVLRIPDGWDEFVYRNWLYRIDANGHFVVVRDVRNDVIASGAVQPERT